MNIMPIVDAESSVFKLSDYRESEPSLALPETRQRRSIGRLALKTIGVGTLLSIGAGAGIYQLDATDQHISMETKHSYIIEHSPVLSQSAVIPEQVYAHLDQRTQTNLASLALGNPTRHLATTMVSGFGRVKTPYPQSFMKPFEQVGALWEEHYDNGGLNTQEMAEQTVKKAEQENVTEIGEYGDSMGGLIQLDLATRILRLDPNIRIPYIILDSTPAGAQGLRPKSRSDGYALINSLKSIPDAQDSRYLRVVAEVYLRWNLCLDPDTHMFDMVRYDKVFKDVVKEVFDDSDLASNELMADQFRTILTADPQEQLKELGQLPEDRRPVIVYIRAAHPSQDDVVNDDYSVAKFREWTTDAHLTMLEPYSIEDFHHGDQYRSAAQYRKVLGSEVIPDIEQALESPAKDKDSYALAAGN